MEDVRAILQVTMRRFGMLNKNCCSVENHDISQVQSHILYELARKEGPSMLQVAETIGMDITTFSRQIQNLVKLELVEKRQSTDDKRIYHLHLTDKGQDLEDGIHQQMLQYLSNIFSNLSEKESEDVLEALKVLNKALGESSMCCKPLF